MKRNLLITITLSLVFVVSNIVAQQQPDSETHLKHFYDFENNVAEDLIGDANAQEMGAYDYTDGALDITDESDDPGYLSFPADVIAINSYSAVTVETWAIPSFSINDGNALMMWAFGTAGGAGTNYLFFVPARFTDQVAVKLSLGDSEPWANEQGIQQDNAAVGDEALHHYVVTIDEDNMLSLYIDGEIFGDPVEFVDGHGLAGLSNTNLFIGKSLYDADPTWKGLVELFSIWDAALSADEVLWLYQQGEKRSANPTSLEDVTKSTPYNFYISNNRLFVKNLKSNVDVSIAIYNITGNLVYKNENFNNGENLNLNQGVYIVKSSVQNNSVVQRVVVK